MFGSDELAKEIAKATDQRDVHTYVHKEADADGPRILSIIRPAKFPERLRPFLNALSAAVVGMVEITKIDATLGEVVVAFASAGIDKGLVIINPPQGEWVDEEQVKMIFKQAGLGNWSFEGNDGINLRAKLYDLMDQVSTDLKAIQQAPLVLPIDQHFNVKGIGLVAIGYVQSGTVNVHDELVLLPANGTGNTKSLQVMDDDVPSAVAGDRVGLALRNAKEDHLGSGTILVRPAIEDKKSGTSHSSCSSSTQFFKNDFDPLTIPKERFSGWRYYSCQCRFTIRSWAYRINRWRRFGGKLGITVIHSERKSTTYFDCPIGF